MSLIEEISKAIVELEDKKAEDLVKKAIAQEVDPLKLLEEGIVPGIKAVGRKFEEKEYFVAEVIIAADITEKCISLIEPKLPRKRALPKKVVIGTVQGDIHGIGKGLVSLMLKVNGFEVHDLGVDVPIMTFIDKAEEIKADAIGLSAIMFTTMPMQKMVIKYLIDMRLRDKFKVVIGGGPTTKDFAESIGADGWAEDSTEAVKVFQNLTR